MHQLTINSRILTSEHSMETELKLHKQKNYLFDLSYLGILDIQGDKSFDFLQGQFTCDLRLVSDIQMIQGIQCNLKGRILTLFDLILWDNYKLILPIDLRELTQNSLNKTAQLSRISIQPDDSFKIFGFYLQNHSDLIPDTTFMPEGIFAQAYHSNYCYYHLGKGFYIFIIKKHMEKDFCSSFKENDQLLGSLAWHTLRLYQNQIDIYPESRGLFLPHRLGFHETSYISFDKGCYKGQEIIARTHYKATIKHELKVYIIQWTHRLYSGQRVFTPDKHTELGEIIDYSPLDNNSFLIATSLLKHAPQLVCLEGEDHLVMLDKV